MSNERSNATSRPAIAPPLKWHIGGGKHYLAPKIVALMPPHLHYVEPYAGGLAVLLAKDPEGVSEVVNDLNRRLTQFWAVLQDAEQFALFSRRAQATPFSEDEYAIAAQAADIPNGQLEPWEHAVNFFIHCRQSMSGRMKCFSPITRRRTRRGMNEQASAWMGAVDGLPEVHARLRRVVILNREALDVIRSQDGKDTLFYLDPPYIDSTRTAPDVYEYEMPRTQHCDLIDTLATIEGKFMLSGYRSPLYDHRAKVCGWNRHDFDLPNNAAKGDEKRRMTECVWTNFG